MRIVELIPALTVGGAERIVALLSVELAALGHDVSVVSLGASSDSWIERDLAERGLDVHFLGKSGGFHPSVMGHLGKTLHPMQPDVVHTHLHVLKYLLPVARLVGKPLIAHTLHNLADKEASASDRALQQVAFRGPVLPVAIGDAVAESVREVYRLDASAVIPNGVEVARFQAPDGTREALRAELGLPAAAPVFVVVGRLNAQKNHRLMLEAFADPLLAEHAPHLLIVGDGDLRPGLEQQAAQAGLSERVHFLGIRRDVPNLLAAADAFVLSSDYEGNPLVVMEAMAAGKAVVSTSVGCVPELVTAETGLLVPPGDAEALSAALLRLSAEPRLATEMGAAALDRARARFDVSAMARAYAALFEAHRGPAAG